MKIIQIARPPSKKTGQTVIAGTTPKYTVNGTNNVINLNYVKKITGDTDGDIQKRSIKIYSLQKFKNQILHKRNIWTIYKFDKPTWDLLVLKDRTRYENLVCGYLQYYDMEVRNGMTDHGVYFHWGKWNNDPYCCVIFTDPRPRSKKPNYKDDLKTNRFGKKYYGEIEEVDPPVSQISDPPKPPPPPPPY